MPKDKVINCILCYMPLRQLGNMKKSFCFSCRMEKKRIYANERARKLSTEKRSLIKENMI